jgi:hypothetical protein
MRFKSMPREKQYLANQALLVSTVYSSLFSAFQRSPVALCSGRLTDLAAEDFVAYYQARGGADHLVLCRAVRCHCS